MSSCSGEWRCRPRKLTPICSVHTQRETQPDFTGCPLTKTYKRINNISHQLWDPVILLSEYIATLGFTEPVYLFLNSTTWNIQHWKDYVSKWMEGKHHQGRESKDNNTKREATSCAPRRIFTYLSSGTMIMLTCLMYGHASSAIGKGAEFGLKD